MEKIIIDEARFLRTISRIAHEIIEKHPSLAETVIVGIKRRGADIAALIKQRIAELVQTDLPLMALDITFYRDDLTYAAPHGNDMQPHYHGASPVLDIQNKNVILVDDVLFTGRTVRAAMDALNQFGRAARIELVIFVDRGHRELPIRADYVGKNVPTAKTETVRVCTPGFDQCYQVVLQTN